MQLVLSLFPGIGLLDQAFELEGFCVVRGPDVLWGGDIRRFHPPSGKFDGVIGGPPCQTFSRLSHMVRHNGYEPKFGNLIPDFERVIEETQPQWFVMEEVPDAPRPSVEGYANHEFMINNRQCIDENGEPAVQNRVRAITFGHIGEFKPLMIDTCVFHNQRYEYAACGGSSGSSLGAAGWDGGADKKTTRQINHVVKGTLNRCQGGNIKSKRSLQRLCELQGLPADYADRLPFTVSAACKAIGNGVPLPMGRAIAKAVKEVIYGHKATD